MIWLSPKVRKTVNKMEALGLLLSPDLRDCKYFLSISRDDFPDGSITGDVCVFTTPEETDNAGLTSRLAKTIGDFRVDGSTGLVTRGPVWLVRLINT